MKGREPTVTMTTERRCVFSFRPTSPTQTAFRDETKERDPKESERLSKTFEETCVKRPNVTTRDESDATRVSFRA